MRQYPDENGFSRDSASLGSPSPLRVGGLQPKYSPSRVPPPEREREIDIQRQGRGGDTLLSQRKEENKLLPRKERDIFYPANGEIGAQGHRYEY
jgi:hypothetical protein